MAGDARVCFVHNVISVGQGLSDPVIFNGIAALPEDPNHPLRAQIFRNFFDEDGHVRDRPSRGTFFMPQVKSRMFEAAQSVCVLAVLRDPWNLLERYFEEDEYVSVGTNGELFALVRDVRHNPLRYRDMVARATKRVSRYTVQTLSDRIASSASFPQNAWMNSPSNRNKEKMKNIISPRAQTCARLLLTYSTSADRKFFHKK